jgi:hypothetical protein
MRRRLMAGKNPRQPNAVLALIAKHSKAKAKPVPVRQVTPKGQIIPSASLWSRLRKRKP